MLDALRQVSLLILFLLAPIVALFAFDTYHSFASTFLPALAESVYGQGLCFLGAVWNGVILVTLARDIVK